jgi:lipopolysaccharide biosynthesis glycosyltransferase
MNILIACNEKYLHLSRYLLFSLHEHNGELNIYLIHENLSDTSIEDITNFINKHNIGKLNIIKFDSSTIDLPLREGHNITGHITKEAYFRLYAPFYLPEDMERILYLDCDIICNDKIDAFYNQDFKDNIFVACRNTDLDNALYNERLNLPKEYTYVNSGVLLFNLKEYKKYTSIEKLNKFISENRDILDFQDQDVVNKMFHEHILEGEIFYNFQIGMLLYTENGILVHYTGPIKPWNDKYSRPVLAQPYYDTLLKLNELDELERIKKCHRQSFKEVNKLVSVVMYGDTITEEQLSAVSKQTETNSEFVIVYNTIDNELKEKYEELDVRLLFVDYEHENEQLDKLTGGYAVFFNIEEFKKMDINFIREITYFVTINNLSIAFFSNYNLDSNRRIIDNEYQFTLENIHKFMDIKKENKYNNIYMVDANSLNNKYGIWDK